MRLEDCYCDLDDFFRGLAPPLPPSTPPHFVSKGNVRDYRELCKKLRDKGVMNTQLRRALNEMEREET